GGVGLSIGAVSWAGAQQRQVFQWAGRVDQEIRLTISGRDLTATNIGPSEPGSRISNVLSPVPRTDGELSLGVLEGRGDVDVLQQPTARNGYTAVIRIRDPQGGAGAYRINGFWQPSSAGEVVRPIAPPFRRGRGLGRDPGNRVALMWSGDVDDNLEILLQPSGVSYRTIRGAAPRRVQSALPRTARSDAELEIDQTEGRGEVV